jgi:galactose-1-phosphate uridylyltransferase
MEVMQVRQRLQSSAQTQKEEMKTTVHNMFSKALPDATPAQKATLESIVASVLGETSSRIIQSTTRSGT